MRRRPFVRGVAAFVALAWFGVAVPVAGQVNIERYRGGGRTVGASLSAYAGNVELAVLNVHGGATFRRNATRTLLILEGDVAWRQGARIMNQALFHARQTFRVDHRLQPEVFAQMDYAKSRSLDLRALVGLGPRLRIASTATKTLAGGVTYMVEHEELSLPPDARHPSETTSHRLSAYMTGSREREGGVTVSGTLYTQPRLDAWSDVRLLGDGLVTVPLGRRVQLDVSVDFRYDSEPPDGRDAMDLTYRTGFSVTF